MKIFDYIFYRVAKYFYKSDGSDAFRSITIVSILQGMMFIDLCLFFRGLFLTQSDLQPYVKYGRFIGIIFAIVLLVFNYRYFKSKYWRLSDIWLEEEKENQTLRITRGWLVVLAIALPFILYVVPFILW